MKEKKYSIGIDFGSLSGRTVVVDVETGDEIGSCEHAYSHAVMSESLPNGTTKLATDFALQHPQDYLDVFSNTIPKVLKDTNISPNQIVGVGIDFTACTALPVLKDGTPLCFLDEYKDNAHAYVKLWKHHAAQDEANALNEIAEKMNEDFLKRYGGKISSEWLIPKIWQIADEDPDLYKSMDRFIEAADWVVWQLTGKEVRNSCTAGYKALWHKQKGYPSKEFFKALNPLLENVVEEKLSNDITSIGEKAGEITESAAKLTGLLEGTPVAVGNVDAHVCAPALGITKSGQMLMIMGTSTCHILLGDEEKQVDGICGVVEDGVLPGYLGYEAGQSCVGDHFDWFVKNCVPESYQKEAQKQGINIHKLLRNKAEKQKPGESGLLALDWWNGNRSILVDADLTGMMLGMTLLTKPEEIYRALIEATAYGTRMIIENFKENGVAVNELFAAGGIPAKDEFTMQIYADVTNSDIKISGSNYAGSLGSAMFGAVAAGNAGGGYDDIFEAAKYMSKIKDKVYVPNPENVKIYDKLFAEYKRLHDYFGRGENDVMKRLKDIKKGN